MMRLILSHRHPHDDGTPVYQALQQFPVVIGRGFSCDVIVSDAYVAPRQAVIRATEDGWELSDLGGRNATRLNGRALLPGAWTRLRSGDRITLGRHDLEVFAPEHAVADTLPMPRGGGLFDTLGHGWAALPVFLLALASTAGWSYLELWSDEPAMTTALAVAGSVFAMLVWAGLWSIVGRLSVHRSRFAAQLGVVSLYVFVSLWLSMLLVGADFLLSGGEASQILSTAVQGLLLFWLVYGCLTIATDLPRRRRWQGALGFAGGLVASIAALGWIGAQGFDPMPPYAVTLEPALSRFAPAVDADSFIADSGRLFDDEIFAASPEAAPQQSR